MQLAKARDANMIGTAAASTFYRELGADEAIDDNASHFEEVVAGIAALVERGQLRPVVPIECFSRALGPLLGAQALHFSDAGRIAIELRRTVVFDRTSTGKLRR